MTSESPDDPENTVVKSGDQTENSKLEEKPQDAAAAAGFDADAADIDKEQYDRPRDRITAQQSSGPGGPLRSGERRPESMNRTSVDHSSLAAPKGCGIAEEDPFSAGETQHERIG